MQGKIIKGIAGFYYVYTQEFGIYECKAKGIFRKEKKKPLVGDNVIIDILSTDEKTGNIVKLGTRSNELIRPAVANVDQALVIFAVKSPNPNLNLLDRFLIMMERQAIATTICFNKQDLATDTEVGKLMKAYDKCGYDLLFTSVKEEEGIDEIYRLLEGKTTVLAGPSGVGKSSLINCLQPTVEMETGELSGKIGRGRHTTRHTQLILIKQNTFIMDTPGFSSLYIPDFEKEDLKEFFLEFNEFEPKCRFMGCSHINERDCGVKEALENGQISTVRYANYVAMYAELKAVKRY
ncbi:ribosome small subunit-dependent GTPase A [Lachnospiraceae bacterium ZAX-1]